MIIFRELSLRIGPHPLLSDVSLTLHSGRRHGVIGRNGAGKSSLFRLLAGELSADSGTLDMPDDLRIAWMRQEVAASERSALDFVLDGHGPLRALEQALATAEAEQNDTAMARLHGEMELIEGYVQQHRAARLLSGLGFSPDSFQSPVSAFSGGWRIRLNLARTLMMPSDLLLLDEPTNHLDLEATVWLQSWLQQYPGTLMLISHDRLFLDGVVDHILSFEQGGLRLYRGNYSDYETQKAERLAQQQAAFEKQQARVAEVEAFVRRFRAKASKATQAQSRLKELERMTRIAPAHVDSPFDFHFAEPDRLPDRLLSCDELSIGYDAPLVSGIRFNLQCDTRIGLLGANGEGKSTLLKTLAGQLEPLAGDLNTADHLRCGYLAQHHVDTLDGSASPLQLLQRQDPRLREQEGRNFLGRFDFRGERVDERIQHFSGGEKARLALALVVWHKPNLLLLDEPTNHLDLEMREALVMALQSFSGALVLVSHDRYLLNNAVDAFWLVRKGRVEAFDGTLADYENLLSAEQSRQSGQSSNQAQSGEPVRDKKQKRQEAAAQRQKLQPMRRELDKLEKELSKIQARMTELDTLLSESSLYESAEKTKLQDLLKEKGQLDIRQTALEDEWLQLGETLESAQESG